METKYLLRDFLHEILMSLQLAIVPWKTQRLQVLIQWGITLQCLSWLHCFGGFCCKVQIVKKFLGPNGTKFYPGFCPGKNRPQNGNEYSWIKYVMPLSHPKPTFSHFCEACWLPSSRVDNVIPRAKAVFWKFNFSFCSNIPPLKTSKELYNLSPTNCVSTLGDTLKDNRKNSALYCFPIPFWVKLPSWETRSWFWRMSRGRYWVGLGFPPQGRPPLRRRRHAATDATSQGAGIAPRRSQWDKKDSQCQSLFLFTCIPLLFIHINVHWFSLVVLILPRHANIKHTAHRVL